MDKKSKSSHNILIVVPKYGNQNKKDYSYQFPLGLSYIVAAIKDAGYSVDGLNLNHHNGAAKELINTKLNEKEYDFVGTGGNALYYNPIKDVVDAARTHPTKPRIVLGGPIITSEPLLMFDNLKPDFGVRDEGEECVVELLDHFFSNKQFNKINGLVYSENGKTILNLKREPPKNLDMLPLPDIDTLGYEEYLAHLYANSPSLFCSFDNPKLYTLLSSRSCPFGCTFCYHENRKYRERSIKNIMEELSLVIPKYKINQIIILDELFAIKKERLMEFCREFKKLTKKVGWDVNWFAQLRASTADEETLRIMKDAGCHQVGYGFESFSAPVLESMKKMATPKELENAFHTTFKVGVGIEANFIFGDPAETKETARETLNWWKKNCKGQLYLDFIQPYPGSEVYKHCVRKGIIKDRLQFIKNLGNHGNIVLNMTDKMTDEEVKQLKNNILEALSKYRHFIIPRKMKKVSDNCYNLEVKCPHCNEIIKYGNFFIGNPHFFGVNASCRNCNKHFYVCSRLKKIVYKNMPLVKKMQTIFSNSKINSGEFNKIL